jgi:hypothetical protein
LPEGIIQHKILVKIRIVVQHENFGAQFSASFISHDLPNEKGATQLPNTLVELITFLPEETRRFQIEFEDDLTIKSIEADLRINPIQKNSDNGFSDCTNSDCFNTQTEYRTLKIQKSAYICKNQHAICNTGCSKANRKLTAGKDL